MPLLDLLSPAPLCKKFLFFFISVFSFLHIPLLATHRERRLLLFFFPFTAVSLTDTYASCAFLCIHLLLCRKSCSILIGLHHLSLISEQPHGASLCQFYSCNVSFLGLGGGSVAVWVLFGDIPPMFILECENVSLEHLLSPVTVPSSILLEQIQGLLLEFASSR